MTDLGALTADDFTPLVGEGFLIAPDAASSFGVTLADVSVNGQAGGARTQFSLLFRGGPTPPLAQRIYRLEHSALGAIDIFLVPLGPDAEGQRYEAVFT